MGMRIAVKRTYVGAALAGALVLGLLWALHPAAGIWGPSSPEESAGTSSEEEPQKAERPTAASAARDIPSAARRPAKESGPTAVPPVPSITKPKVGPLGGRWDHLAYLQGVSPGRGEAGCQEAIRRTAVHLSIDPAKAADFEMAARVSVLEMEQALDLRKRELSTLPREPGASGPSDAERRSEERYAAARAKALERLEAYLAQSTAHQDFRWSFDSWACLVTAKTRGEDR